MTTQKHRVLRPMEAHEWYRDELGMGFNETFDLETFEPTTKGFTEMAEDEVGYAASMGVALRPLEVALYLIDWWKAMEMRA